MAVAYQVVRSYAKYPDSVSLKQMKLRFGGEDSNTDELTADESTAIAKARWRGLPGGDGTPSSTQARTGMTPNPDDDGEFFVLNEQL